ncbi:MAG: ATP-binding protein [Desulfobacterales bacterium]|nr:ATP-binding protein [Desulfobacterales bacterium]
MTAKYLILFIELIGIYKGRQVKDAFISHLVTAHLPTIETKEEFRQRVMKEHVWINSHLSRLVGFYALAIMGLGRGEGARLIGRAVIRRNFLQMAAGQVLNLNFIYRKIARVNQNFNSVLELTYDNDQSKDGLVVIRKKTKDAYKKRLVRDLGRELLHEAMEVEDQVTKGVLESVPKLLSVENQHNVVLTEPFCELRGDAFCEYHIRIKERAKGIIPIVSGMLRSAFSQLLLKIPMVRKMGEQLIAMEISIQRHTRDLSDVQIQLEERVMKRTRELRKLNAHLVRTEEREKKLMADTLHEGLGQELAISRILVSQLASDLNDSPSAELTDKLKSYLDEMIAKTRAMTNDLSPPVLHELGLEDALVWLGEKVEAEHDIRVEMDVLPGSRPLNPDERTLVFRVAQELFVNIVKHAGADRVKLTFIRSRDLIYFSIEDNGVGFDPGLLETFDSPSNTGYGLYSVRDRIRFAGGRFELESEPGKGCRATLTLPSTTTTPSEAAHA